tara:strand:+ start:1222 stop:1854 length:633 start_codon:yes stop_codon:yes gene_type:complete
MKQVIQTSKGNILFEPTREFFDTEKKINKENSRENLLILRNILIKTQIRWGLLFGTLLGAVREGDFIEWDIDTDIFVFDEDKQDLLDTIKELQDHGFKVIRFNDKKSILSIERKNDYIDFYFFKKSYFGRKCEKYFIPKKFFINLTEIEFFNKNFPTFSRVKEYLEFQYGKTWNIKIKDAYATGNVFTFKEILKKIFPKLFQIYKSIKNK